MKLVLIFSLSLIILSLGFVSTKARRRIQVDSPLIVLQENKNLILDRLFATIINDKESKTELNQLIREFIDKMPGTNGNYVDAFYPAVPAPKTYVRSKNFRIDIQSSQAEKRDTYALQINSGSKWDPKTKGASTNVCNLVITKPAKDEFYFAYSKRKVEGAFNQACFKKKVALVRAP